MLLSSEMSVMNKSKVLPKLLSRQLDTMVNAKPRIRGQCIACVRVFTPDLSLFAL